MNYKHMNTGKIMWLLLFLFLLFLYTIVFVKCFLLLKINEDGRRVTVSGVNCDCLICRSSSTVRFTFSFNGKEKYSSYSVLIK